MIDKDITLSRDIEIHCFDCLADIATNVERRDILAMLELAREEGGQLKAASIVDKLLPGSPRVMGENLVRRYRIMGFIDERGFLTEVASYALETGKTLIPECGQYRIWATDDPLVPQTIIKIQRQDQRDSRLESQKIYYAGNKKNGNNKSRDASKTTELPEWLLGVGNTPVSVWDSGDIDTVSIKKIETRGFRVIIEELQKKLRAKLTLGNGQNPLLHLVTKEKDRTFARLKPPEVDIGRVWQMILEQNKLSWKGGPLEQGYTTMALKNLSPLDRLNFSRRFTLGNIAIGSLGIFGDINVTLKVQPSSQNVAETWGLMNLRDRIGTYVSDVQYNDIVESVKSEFLSYTPKKLPDIQTLAKQVQKDALEGGKNLPPLFWHLQALKDISLAGGEV